MTSRAIPGQEKSERISGLSQSTGAKAKTGEHDPVLFESEC